MWVEILNPRRVPRVPLRCSVEIRHAFRTWSAQTEDVGPGGCRIVTPRSVDPGRELRLVLRYDGLRLPLEAKAKVVWSRREAPARLGVAFRPQEGAAWFDALVAVDPVAGRAARGMRDRLPRLTRVYLGRPPQIVIDFSPVELELLRRIGAGVTLDALARSFGPVLDERTAGALFSLLERRFVVVDPGAAVRPSRWREVLSGEDRRSPGERQADRARDAARPVAAQALYDEALAHLGAGRLGFAVDRLRDALRLAPGDEVIEETLRRLMRWA